ncbi:MAG: hypothetical protein L3J09_09235 [Flavobacteriaceae bacterium]|nr:hypothetical protein [Flavobacteriaceae bacterium]
MIEFLDKKKLNILKIERDSIFNFFLEPKNLGNNRNFNHIGLLSGLPGIILTIVDGLTSAEISEQKKTVLFYIKKTFEIVEETPYLTPSYCDGLAGYGYFLLEIRKLKIVLEDTSLSLEINEILIEIDEILTEQIPKFVEHKNFDIMHGLIGLGLFFLAKKDKNKVLKITEILIQNSYITEKGGVYWKKYDTYDTYSTILDTGNAHGIGANIYFLTKVLSNGIELSIKRKSELTDLIQNSINFYFEIIQNLSPNIYCYFPLKINFESFQKNNFNPENSRLGWCYGDLGTLYTLLMASNQIKNNQLILDITERLIIVSKRKIEDESYTVDAGFCHGTSGMAILWYNIFTITQRIEFRTVALYWLDETLKKKIKMDNTYEINYGFIIEDSLQKNFSILEGLSGVLSCYNKFINKTTERVEDILMIKY